MTGRSSGALSLSKWISSFIGLYYFQSHGVGELVGGGGVGFKQGFCHNYVPAVHDVYLG